MYIKEIFLVLLTSIILLLWRNNMKSNAKLKMLSLITLGIVFALSPIISTNLNFMVENGEDSWGKRDELTSDHKNVKPSPISGKIYIDDNDPNYNWTVAKAAGKCTGQGTYSDPYVIEDFIIDGGGGGSCILIENSDMFFRIENCTLYNSAQTSYNAGIRLTNVTNSQLIDNDCSSNAEGINLEYCNNNTISGNTVSDNHNGIKLWYSDNNTISGNTLSDNISNYAGILLETSSDNIISGNTLLRDGIHSGTSTNNTIFGNIMNECGIKLANYYLEEFDSITIDTTNLVNGKPLYYYTNEVNLGPSDFLNAGQVILANCNDSVISNLNVPYTIRGISLHYCHNNEIVDIIANHNYKGIYLWYSDNNSLSGNTANYNFMGLSLEHCNDNNISGNMVNNNSHAIYLVRCDNNTISGNTANYNNWYGIVLTWSDDNTISGNALIGNTICILEQHCQGNEFSDNGSCTYGEEEDGGDGDGNFPLTIIIIASISIVGGIGVAGFSIILLRRRKRAREGM